MAREPLLNEDQAVAFCDGHWSKRTFQFWRHSHSPVGPPYLKVGRHVFYRVCDLQAWIDAGLVEPSLPPAKHRAPRARAGTVETESAPTLAAKGGDES
jgi:hypothetical protein